jgi:hypothetical protein
MTRIFTFAGNQTRGQLDYCTKMSASCSHEGARTTGARNVPLRCAGGFARRRNPDLGGDCAERQGDRTDASEHLQRAIPQSRLVTIQGAAHASMDEQGDAVRETVAAFAAEVFQTTGTAAFA